MEVESDRQRPYRWRRRSSPDRRGRSARTSGTTWTVKPGGAITAKAGKTTLKDTKTGQSLTCASSTAKTTLKKGSGLSCKAIVDGTSATANNGMVSITYSNSTHKLTVLATGGNLHTYNVQGCLGLIGSGDGSSFSTSYAVSPAQTITSP